MGWGLAPSPGSCPSPASLLLGPPSSFSTHQSLTQGSGLWHESRSSSIRGICSPNAVGSGVVGFCRPFHLILPGPPGRRDRSSRFTKRKQTQRSEVASPKSHGWMLEERRCCHFPGSAGVCWAFDARLRELSLLLPFKALPTHPPDRAL